MATSRRVRGKRAHATDAGRSAYEHVLAGKGVPTGRGKPAGKVVLVTGIGTYWGGRVALAVERSRAVGDLLGLDVSGPAASFSRLEYVHMPLRSPFLVDLLRHRHVDTVVHLDWRGDEKGRERMFEGNVLGTRHLLSACADAGVRRVILRSWIMVYGASADNPNFIPETLPVRARSRDPWLRDLVECESDCREFTHEHPAGPQLTILRFAHVLGASANSPMNRMLRMRELPAVLGFDPLFQFISEGDKVAAFVHAVENEVTGPINVAADRTLPLSRIAAMLGKKLDHSVLALVPSVMRAVSYLPISRRPPIPVEYLKFLCSGDNERMKRLLNFTPELTGPEIVAALARAVVPEGERPGMGVPGYGEYVQRCLDEVLEKEEPAKA